MRGPKAFSGGPKSGKKNPEFVLDLSAPVRHALQALGVLAARPGLSLSAAEAAKRCGFSDSALTKSFQRFAARGILESRRGPGGGYRLSRTPKDVTLAEVAAALGTGGHQRDRCVLEERACRGSQPCALHRAALEADARFLGALKGLTLADLARRAR